MIFKEIFSEPFEEIIKPVFGEVEETGPLKLWLDTSDESTISSSGGNVISISDKSGNYSAFTAINTVTTGDSRQNYNNILNTDGVNSALSGTIDLNNEEFSFIFVVRVKEVANIDGAVFSFKDNLGGLSSITANNTEEFQADVVSSNHTTIVPTDAPFAYNFFLFRYTVTATTAELFINKVSQGSQTLSSAFGTSATVQIGRDSETVPNYVNMDFAEFRFYEGALSTEDAEAIEDSLIDKWAVYDPRTESVRAWWDFSNRPSVVLTGTDINQIASLYEFTGASKTLTSNAGTEPTLVLKGENGLDISYFDPNRAAKLKVGTLSTISTMAFFVVGKIPPIVSGGTTNDSLFSLNSARDFQFQADSTTEFLGTVNTNFAGQINTPVASQPLDDSVWRVYYIGFTLPSTSNGIEYYINKDEMYFTGTVGTAIDPNGTFRLAANRAPSVLLECDIGEVLVVNNPMTAEIRDGMINYLMAKWDVVT